MNILHISSASTWRGGERQVSYLIEGLNNQDNFNFLMSPENSILSLRSNLKASNLLVFKKGIFALPQNIFSLKKYCTHHQIDIIHGHDSHAHTLLWLAYKFGGLQTKSVITRRLINPIKKRSLKKYNFSKIERIICISEAVKKMLIQSIEDPSRLIVIHSTVKIPLQGISKKKITSKKDFIIGYVAAFTQEKDHKTFIDTARVLKMQYPEISYKFLLVGDGPLLQKTKEQCRDMDDQFEFTGFVKEIAEVYNRMDLLLHTSKSEALGTSILDAMKFGIPVIATNIGGIPEIVTHRENGYLSEPGDFKKMSTYVYKISSNKSLQSKFRQNAFAKVQHFDVKKMVNKTFELYQKILNA